MISTERNKVIVRTSIGAIIVNLALVTAKMIAGTLSGSIAIVLDAVNNMGDALSSIITIFGAKLASAKPDKEHPYGHGRIEYISAVGVSAIVLIAGITSAKESVTKIFHPTPVDYTAVTFAVLVLGIVTKLAVGAYVKSVGEKVEADSLIASGVDALSDAVLSASTLAAALMYIFFDMNVEGFIGLIISVVIVKSAVSMLSRTMDNIIGVRADGELTKNIKADIRKIPGVRGAFDLTLHNYGPEDIIGSVHVEVDDSTTAQEIQHITNEITYMMEEKYGIDITVGIYAANVTGDYILSIRGKVAEIVKSHREIIGFHGLYADRDRKIISFDIVLNFKTDARAVKSQVIKEVSRAIPGYKIVVKTDTSYTD